MLMYVEMDFNTVQVLTFVVYQYMYMTNCYCNCFMFLLFFLRSENCGIRSNGLTPVLFIRSKGENCTRRFSAVIQCSSLNVATTSM